MDGSYRSGKSVSFITMGCAKNEVDTAHMAARLRAAGYEVVDEAEQADAIIVNTCSFIQEATEESIGAILEACELDNVASGRARLVVAGCLPARYGEELEPELPEAHAFIPCSEEDNVVGHLDDLFGIERIGMAMEFEAQATRDGACSSYVKISDGCDRFCSYCMIPRIRGRYHSFAEQSIEREVSGLIASGSREIVLIAQDTGRWGDDLENQGNLATLVSGLAQRHPDTWFRIMYIQPEGVTDELVEAIATHDNICSYFDIPFQHCNPSVLERMNRKGSAEEFIALVRRIRERIPDATLRTTLIAGFPGETEEQFQELCDFIEEIEFDYVGVFPYSQEMPSRAGSLDGQLDEETKLERAQELRDIADAVSSSIVSSRVGKTLDVLVCGTEEDGQVFGRAQCQAPDVDGVTFVDGGDVGDIVSCTIQDTMFYEMEGTVAS